MLTLPEGQERVAGGLIGSAGVRPANISFTTHAPSTRPRGLLYKTGNLLEAPEIAIAHCVNTQGAFGSGVAGQIAKKWPAARNAYKLKFEKEGWKLGDIQIVQVTADKEIYNLAGQEKYGYDGKLYLSYLALYKCFTELFHICESRGIYQIAMPLIGAGLAGGDWPTIQKIIEKCLGNRDMGVTIYKLPPSN